MFVNFCISVTVIVQLLAKSKAPRSAELGTISVPLVQLLSCSVHFFLRFFEFGNYF